MGLFLTGSKQPPQTTVQAIQIMKRISQYALLISLTTGIAYIAIYILKSYQFVNAGNRVYVEHGLQALFLMGVILLGWQEMGYPRITKSLFSVRNSVLLSLSLLLILCINQSIGQFATGLFVTCAFVYFLRNGKLYEINRVYYFLFLYVLLRFLGTIGTNDGFRFPEKLFTFILLPLAFSFVRIEKRTSFRVLYLFFRAMLIYMSCTLVYWWYNIQYFGLNIGNWLISKETLHDGFPPYHWTSGWALYEHPSYISLVLVAGLISGFYLYFKKQPDSIISQLELIVYAAFITLTVLVMESRIGVVMVALTIAITLLYYLRLKSRHFKQIAVVVLVVGMGGLFYMGDSVSGFMDDNVRRTDNTLALNYIKAHPWWGVGFHQQALALKQQEQIMLNVLPALPFPKTYTHNQLLGDMVQFGVAGALVLVLLIVGLVGYSIQSRSYLLQLLMCVCIVFMCIEEPLYGQAGITRFMVFLSFFVHISESGKPIKSYTILRRNLKSDTIA